MKKLFTVALLLFAAGFMAVSENFDILSKIISTEKITNAQAAYIAGISTGDVTDRSNEQDAFASMVKKGYFKPEDKAEDLISLSQLCSLFAKVTDQKGGVMFMITKKSPRYSYNEFVGRGFISRNCDPQMKVKGTDAIGLFNLLTEVK